MDFTQESLRLFLSRIFFTQDASPYVVPKQGNWHNPQDRGITPTTPDTWIAFQKQDSDPRIIPYYQYTEDGKIYSTVFKIARCQVQIVGAHAEEWAESIAHWMHRGDVQSLLDSMNAQLLGDDCGKIVVSPFNQDGLNAVLAYNTGFNIEWASTIEATEMGLVTGAEFSGEVFI